MEGDVQYGGPKTGQPFDAVTFISKPQVIIRFFCWLFSVIVFGCITSKGWTPTDQTCVFNKSGNACRFANILGLIGLKMSIAFLIMEAMFNRLSSVKLRRRAVGLDLGFSSAWAALYLIGFVYLWISWCKSEYPEFGYGINSARTVIAFCLLSALTWAACAWLAWQRWLVGEQSLQSQTPGAGMQTDGSSGYQQQWTGDPSTGYDQQGIGQYSAYVSGSEVNDPNYQTGSALYPANQMQDVPFQQNNYQQPSY